MKLSAAGTLVAASSAVALIGLGAPAFASAGHVAHQAKTACYCGNGASYAGDNPSGGDMGGWFGGGSLEHRRDLSGLLDRLTDDILRIL